MNGISRCRIRRGYEPFPAPDTGEELSVADRVPKLGEEGLDGNQPAGDVLPEDRAVFVDEKIEAARRPAPAERPVTADDDAIRVADEWVGCVD
jgi:hypothetical protein